MQKSLEHVWFLWEPVENTVNRGVKVELNQFELNWLGFAAS